MKGKTVSKQPAAPRYRIVADIVFISGCEFRRGAETTSRAWPSRDMEPLNEPARRIENFWARYQAFPLFPTSPVAGAHGFFLPAILPRSGGPALKRVDAFNLPGTHLVSPVPADQVTPAMPTYKIANPHKRQHVGNHEYKPGSDFAWLAWPDPDEGFLPTNEQARRVVAYVAQYKDHPSILSAPWCWFRQDIYLPALPTVGKSGHAREPLSPPMPIPTAHESRVTNSAAR